MARGSGGASSGGERYSRKLLQVARVSCDRVLRSVLALQVVEETHRLRRASSDMGVEIGVQRFQRAPADFGVPGLLVAPQPMARGFVQLRQQVERDVRRLIVARIGCPRCNGTAIPARSRAAAGAAIRPAPAPPRAGPPSVRWRSIPRSLPRPRSGPRRRPSGRERSCSVGVNSAGALM